MRFPGYALLIGTGTTQSRQFAPIPVTNDIAAIKSVLSDPGVCGYPAENITVLTDAQATSANIDRGLAWLKDRSAQNPGATIIVYYSGHGWSDSDDHYYLIQYDVSDEYLSDTAYDAQNLLHRLNKIPARQMVVVLDCCRAGGVAEGKDQSTYVLAKGRDTAPPTAVQEALSQGGSRVVFASSLEGQKSWFHPDVAISLFTYYFLEALQGGNARTNDTQVHIDQLIGHVSREVEAASRGLPAIQTPTFILKGLNFPLALLQGGKGLGPGGWPAAKPQADATIARVVRQITQTVGQGGVAIGGDASGATIVTGAGAQVARGNARITDASGAQGYIENAGDVSQDFSQRTVTTNGGDYAEGDITRTTQSGGVNASGATFGNNATLAGGNVTRGHVTVSGGTHGVVVGVNQGTISHGASGVPANPPAHGIQHALDRLNPLLARLHTSGDEELHDHVHQVILYLRDALRAEQKADLARRANKIRQAQTTFAEIDSPLPELVSLRSMIDHLV